MAVVAFDTLKLADRREAGGFTSGQARAVSGAFADAMSGSDLATKADLQSEVALVRADLKSEGALVRTDLKSEVALVRTDLKSEIAAVRADLKSEIAAVRANLKSEIAAVRADISEVKSEILKWMFGAMAAQIAIILTVVKLMGH